MTTSTRTPLGVTLVDGGANVALFSSTAERVEFYISRGFTVTD